MLIGFSRTAGDARAFAARHRYRIDINQESVAQGLANVGAGLFQGMPVSTSLSASSLNDHIRCARPPHPVGVGAAVLRSAQGGARGPDHRGGGPGDDGCSGDAPPRRGPALRLLGRGRGDRRDAACRRARRRDGRGRPLATLAHLGGDASPDAPARSGAGHAGLQGAGRAPEDERFPA